MIPASLQSSWGDRMLTHETDRDSRQHVNGRINESTKQVETKTEFRGGRLLYVAPKSALKKCSS